MASSSGSFHKPPGKPPAKSSEKTGDKAAAKPKARSQKLGRTLKELESAFTDWETLSTAKGRADQAAAQAEDSRKSKAVEKNEEEFRKKTKKLLSQLRQQLSELND